MAGTSSAGNSGLPDVQPFGEEDDVRILEQGADEDGENQDASDDEDDDQGEEGQEGEGEGDEGEGQEEDGTEEEEGKEGEEDEEKPVVEDTPGRPTLRAIKEKYPDIFKNFPDLRAVIFREGELSKHFATVDEAEEAATKARNYDIVNQSLMDGSPELLLGELKTNNPDALAQIVENFLPKVQELSNDLYLKATVPVVEELLWKVFAAAERSGDKNLKFSAQHINRYLFGDHNVKEPKPPAENKPHPAEQKLAEERARWAQDRFNEAKTTFNSNIDRRMEQAVVQGLDPNNALRPYLRKALIRDIIGEVGETLAKDDAHVRYMGSLWRKAANAGFPKDQIASIENAFLARAKQLVPGIRNRLRAEALGKERREEKPNVQGKKKSVPSGGHGAGRVASVTNPKDIDYSKTSDMDILTDKIQTRRTRQ